MQCIEANRRRNRREEEERDREIERREIKLKREGETKSATIYHHSIKSLLSAMRSIGIKIKYFTLNVRNTVFYIYGKKQRISLHEWIALYKKIKNIKRT